MPDFSTRPCYFDLAGGTDLYWSDNFEGSPLGQYYDTTGGSPPSWRSVSNANVGPPSTGINPAICQATTDYIPTATAGNRVMMYNVDNNHGTSSARKRCMLRNMDQQPVTGSFPNNDQLYTGKHYHVQFDLLVPSAYWSGPLYGEPNSNWQTGAMALQWMDYVTDENGKDNPVFTCTVQQATGEFRKLSFASQGNHGGLRFEDYWSQLVPLDEFFTVNMHVYFAGEGVAGSICEAWVTTYEADGLTIAATEQVTNRRGIKAGPDDPWRQTMSMGLYDAGRGYNDALPGEPERRELVNTNWFIGVEGDTQPIFEGAPPPPVPDRPEITDFTVPSVSESLIISPITLTATDDVAVTGYQITESSTPPTPADPDWSGSAPTSYAVLSEGSVQLYAWAIDADDNVSSETSSVCDVRVNNSPKIYKESEGLTVMEAENNSLNVENTGYFWELNTDFAGYQGVGAMRSLPTTGVSVIDAADAVESAPEMQFQVESIDGGIRYVWLRALADGNQNTIHVGYPGQVVWDGMSFVGDATWQMTNKTFLNPVCTLTLEPGITTISVWPRELGCVLDRVILTDDPSYTPTGLEPESIIKDALPIPSYINYGGGTQQIPNWTSDLGFTTGGSDQYSERPIDNTLNDAVFWSRKVINNDGIDEAVTKFECTATGTYNVFFMFAEQFYEDSGNRLIDIDILTELSNENIVGYDFFEDVGAKDTALLKQANAVTLQEGDRVTIKCRASVGSPDNATLCGIIFERSEPTVALPESTTTPPQHRAYVRGQSTMDLYDENDVFIERVVFSPGVTYITFDSRDNKYIISSGQPLISLTGMYESGA